MSSCLSTVWLAKAESGRGLSTEAVLVLCSGFPGHVPVLSCLQVTAVRGLVRAVHLGDRTQPPVGMSCIAAFPVRAPGDKAWPAWSDQPPPDTGAELQDMLLPVMRAISFSAAEQNKAQLWARSSHP